MDNKIEKFDPSKLMDGIKDRIKATFVSLIPDEQWESMIEKEIYVFILVVLKCIVVLMGVIIKWWKRENLINSKLSLD